MANLTQEQILRRFLNPAIKGKFVTAVLRSIATGDEFNAQNVLAVKDQVFMATATGTYLDKLLSQIGIVRPSQTGIDDDTLRDLAIAQTNTKLVTNIFLQVLEAFYGKDAVSSNMLSSVAETYALEDGMQLVVEVDDNPKLLTVTFHAADFSSIAAAKAIEVANVISRASINQGYTLTSDEFLDNITGDKYVQLLSGTRGPKSSIRVRGGEAQNILRFSTILPTTQDVGTQFTMSISGGNVRFTWTSGADPGIGIVEVDDYVNIFGSGFDPNNRGTFPIRVIQSGAVGNSYFEVENPNFTAQSPVTLGTVDDVLFFDPTRVTLNNLVRKASVYEVNPYEIVVLLPVTTKIVKRQLIGSAHLNPSVVGSIFPGPYLYSPRSGFGISGMQTNLTQDILAGQVYSVVNVQDSSRFPDSEGHLVFEYGYDQQEGPVRYFGRSSSSSLLLDPSYKFKKDHDQNTQVNLVNSVAPIKVSQDGSDYPLYLTDSIVGRIEAENMIRTLTASGVFLNVIVVVPDGTGLNDVNFVYGVTE